MPGPHSACLSPCLSVCPSVRLSVRPSFRPSVRSSVRPSIRMIGSQNARPVAKGGLGGRAPLFRWRWSAPSLNMRKKKMGKRKNKKKRKKERKKREKLLKKRVDCLLPNPKNHLNWMMQSNRVDWIIQIKWSRNWIEILSELHESSWNMKKQWALLSFFLFIQIRPHRETNDQYWSLLSHDTRCIISGGRRLLWLWSLL